MGLLHSVRVERNVLIPLSDGVRLAGDLFLPESAGRVPALVSYYPYHKDDLIGALFDHPNRYFAARGYASLLVDLRGLGSSEGVAWEVGDPREGIDGAEIVEWAAAQPWCDGSVGMWGMSYGGITSFKTAALRPPHLKAIVPMNGCLDHYDDLLYPGGCFNCLGIIGGWGPFMTAMNLMPPMSQDADGRWERVWRARLDRAQPPFILPYQEHPNHDDYWQSKSIAGDRIQAPTFLIGGWRDIFPEAMVRAYERIPAPRRLLMGPWMHEMPDLARFAKVDYLAEMLRWWDHWLKGVPNGVADEPPVVIYVQGAGWRHEREWPIARAEEMTVFLAADPGGRGGLTTEPSAKAADIRYTADPTIGWTAGLWDPTGTGLGAPIDQGPDDLRSITFTGDPLPRSLEITGSAEATLFVAVEDGSDVNLVVKLCDVAPDGRSELVTTGWLKGSHRVSHGEPAPLIPGGVAEYRVALFATSYRIDTGHRLRVSIACADFPRIWPTLTNPRIRLALGGPTPSAIHIPTIPGATIPGPELPVPDPEVARTPHDIEGQPRWTVCHDVGRGSLEVSTGIRTVIRTPNGDGRLELERTGTASVERDRPDGAKVEATSTIHLQTPTGSMVVIAGQLLVTQFGQRFSGRVTVDGQVIFDHIWQRQAIR